MKKLLAILVIPGVLAAVAGCLIGIAAPRSMGGIGKLREGSGVLVTRSFDTDDFEALEVGGCTEVTLVEGSGPVIVKADDNVMEFVVVCVEEGTLRIGLSRSDALSFGKITLRATVPTDSDFRALRAEGAARIHARTLLRAEKTKIEASGASNIRTSVRSGECRIGVSGAADVEIDCDTELTTACLSGASKLALSGTTARLKAETSGAAQLRAAELDAEICRAEASGASKISLRCTRKLTADASGAAKITYTGGSIDNTVSKSGAGSVKRR